jgi:hypothetical protein
VVLLILNIINDVKAKDFSNIKYYAMILIPFIYVLIILFVNYHGRIYFDEKKYLSGENIIQNQNSLL